MKAYDFNTFKDFFEFYIQKNLVDENGQKKLTLNDLAKKLGYNSASSLSMIASGERLPSSHLLESLFDEWKLTSTEKQRVRLKVEIEKRKRKGKESAHLITQFNKLAPYKKIDLKNFHVHILIAEFHAHVVFDPVFSKNGGRGPLYSIT